jgi:glycine/D-amino acid oxidase-like deaminating enzyme
MCAESSQPSPTQADVVVIGAGAFGFSVGYQLTRLGAGSVVVLDQYEPATQVSPKAAGLFKMIQASETKTSLARLARKVVTSFETETGVPMPHVQSGSLLIARSGPHASMIDAETEDARDWGVTLERIDGTEARRICPYIVTDRFLAVYHVPDDFYIEEPRSMLMAYWQAGAALGMQVIGHAPVTGITTAGGAVSAVETPNGAIRTPLVIDAAGVWSRLVGAMAGIDVPVLPVRHQLRITAPLEGVEPEMPIVRVTDASGYARPARGGLMYGGFEADPRAVEHIPATGFTLDMVAMDPTLPNRFRAEMQDSVPAIADAASQEDRGGLFTMTADGRLMAGPVNDVHGFWVATGCNGSGFSLSSAIGLCLAEWIVNGESPLDLSILAPDRFAGSNMTEDELRNRAVWQYVNYYTPRA